MMSAESLIIDLQSKGVRFEIEAEGFRVHAPQGVITAKLREKLAECKPEIVALLKKTDAALQISHIAGGCPHCKAPLLVFTHPADAEVWIQCPTKPELFKALRHEACEWCRDCADKLTVIAGRCAECIQRLMLAPDVPCPVCKGLRFWRHRASSEQPAGFAWYCAECREPSGKVVSFELTGGIEDA
jgi:hypothetical protein